MSKLLILSHKEISLKLDRMAWQIIEDHHGKDDIVLIGIENRGVYVASELERRLAKFSSKEIKSVQLSIDKDAPLSSPISISNRDFIKNSACILVDDVLNSGITLCGAMADILKMNPSSLKVAVLANRDHHKFPVAATYVGISLATTLKEHISFEHTKDNMSVWLV